LAIEIDGTVDQQCNHTTLPRKYPSRQSGVATQTKMQHNNHEGKVQRSHAVNDDYSQSTSANDGDVIVDVDGAHYSQRRRRFLDTFTNEDNNYVNLIHGPRWWKKEEEEEKA
jgi:hypothetical protein